MNCKDCIKDAKCKQLSIDRRGSHKNCFVQKSITSADRIRAMTDEELVALLYARQIISQSADEIRSWLKQEVE